MKNNKSNLLGIYIHIPFCVRKCNYCDFLSFTASEKIKKKYVEALTGEIKYMSHAGRDRLVNSIFLGGGTPSVLDADYIKIIMKAINDNFYVTHNCEATIEANPGTITKEKAEAYRECGFNRISFGLQTTDNDVLKTIGRIHTYEEFLESYEIARKAGFTNINIDMMQALPGQSLEEYVKGLKKVIELKPEHISAYSLIVEEGTHLYEHLSEYPQLPDEDEERQIYYA
ncbi:MAG: radical SAM family heme chaperone HemW, partial [Lachnospiraceae bacterium]